MTEKTDERAAPQNDFSGGARRKIINIRKAIGVFPDVPDFCESFFVFAASLKLKQVSGRNGNICVESIHNEISKIFGIINGIPQSIKSKLTLGEKK